MLEFVSGVATGAIVVGVAAVVSAYYASALRLSVPRHPATWDADYYDPPPRPAAPVVEPEPVKSEQPTARRIRICP